ncbi:MAG: hypothetical protein R6U91_05120 [Bacillota bacterium]
MVGSHCRPFEPALRVLEKKMIDVSPLISATCRLKLVIEGFVYCKEKNPLKVLIDLA